MNWGVGRYLGLQRTIVKERNIKVLKGNTEVVECFVDFNTKSEPCFLRFKSKEISDYETNGIDIFECVNHLRDFLSTKACLLLCCGARRDCYPSGMSRQMSKGTVLYRLRDSCHPTKDDIVHIFDYADPDIIASVKEQRSYYESWIKSVIQPE